MNGAELIAAERRRHVHQEGWTEYYDDKHKHGELAKAAVCYATPLDERECDTFDDPMHAFVPVVKKIDIPKRWPWGISWWKPSPDDRIRELVKAGALIAAEIDRLQRLSRTLQGGRAC